MTGEVALKACACPLCGDPMEIVRDLIRHVVQGRCLIGALAYPVERLADWNTRSPVCEDARARAFEEAALIAEEYARKHEDGEIAIFELRAAVPARIRALAKTPPREDAREELVEAKREAFEEAAKVAECHAAEYGLRRAEAEKARALPSVVLAHHRYYETLLATASRIRELAKALPSLGGGM